MNMNNRNLSIFMGALSLCVFSDMDVDATDDHATVDDTHDWAYRLAAMRSENMYTHLTPVVALYCGIRDPFKYTPLGHHSLDSNYVSHTRCYDRLLTKVSVWNKDAVFLLAPMPLITGQGTRWA